MLSAVIVVTTLLASTPEASARLEVRAAVPHAVVSIDGVLRGLAPRTEELRPGPHEVLVEAPGWARRARVVLEPGQLVTLRFDLVPPPSAPRRVPLAGLLTGGAGAVVMTVGLLLRLPAEASAREVSALFRRGGGWDGRAAALEAAGLAAETWSWLLTGLGTALMASGVITGIAEWFAPGPALPGLSPTPGGAVLSWSARF